MENKNTIIALVLMLVVWIGFTVLFPPQRGPVSHTKASRQVADAQPQEHKATPEAPQRPGEKVFAGQPLVKLPPASSLKERDITIENQLFTAVFTNSGARLKSLVLKKYHAKASPHSSLISVVKAGSEQLATLRTTGSGGIGLGADTLYSANTQQNMIRLGPGESRQLVFTTKTPSGVVIEKIYSLHGDRYDFGLQVKIVNQGQSAVQGRMEMALVHPWDKSMAGGRYDFNGPATMVGDKVHTEKVEDLAKKPVTYGSNAVWSAFETKYFMGAAVPLDGSAVETRVEKNDHTVQNLLRSPDLHLAKGQGTDLKYLFYFGPRDLDVLKTVDHHLSKIIDFGFFSILAYPLLDVLKFFYGYVGNYGVAIILLTVIIKILFWPLTQKSYSSMKAMQTLQPEMAKIRERYKNDKEKMNRKIMEMYKEQRVNPLGGCLPMLIQIPVFFALYEVLLNNIALRHAPFIFWLTDLSVKDPYYITPLIMGATMFVQQKMTPTAMDPTQAKLFMVMPVVFTFLFLNFPSGLVIYWLVNNLLTILQQYFINRKPA